MIIALLIAFSIAEANPEAHIGFGSDCDSDLDIFWVNPQGEEVSVTKVAPQGQSWIGSYLNHKFVYRLNGKKVGEATVKSKSQFSVAQCGHPCHEHYGEEPCLERLDGRIRRAQLQPVWDSQNEDRRQTNRIQPQNLKNFTELGFEKRKIPDDVWELLRSYYENNKDSIVLEKWPSTNPYINHWESVPFMIWLPELHTGDETKRKIFEGLRPHLEEWSGTELEHTDLYGMRVYKNNTFLENHVDRVATHVVSAIMHIADKQDIPWPLNIYDHYGNEHNITISPGEMVLYESATCVHGRPSLFQGEYYVNAFAHFRPKNWISHLRGLRKKGKLTKWSRGPGDQDDAWLRDTPEMKDEL